MRSTIIDGFEFVSILYPFNRYDAIKITDDRPIEDYVAYINSFNIEKAEIVLSNLSFLRYCPTLRYLKICPSCTTPVDFDFSVLYEMPEIKSLSCQNQYGNTKQYICEIDYLRISGLINLSVSVNKGSLNYHLVETLKSLTVGNFNGKKRDLSDLFYSRDLDTLRMTGCGIHSLKGIEKALSPLQPFLKRY